MFRYALFIVLATALTVGQSQADTGLEEERARLLSLQQSLSRQQSDLEELRSELSSYPARLSEAEEAVLRAEQEVATLQRDLQELQRQAAVEETLQLSREIPLKEHAISMAERRVRSENRMLERYRRYHDNLRADVAQTERDIEQLRRRISDQQELLAALEAQEQERAQTVTAQSGATTATVATPLPVPQPEPAPVETSTITEAPVVAEPADAEEAVVQEELPPLNPADYEALLLAESTMARVEELIARTPNSNPRFSNLQLSGSDIPPTSFEHLGADQYRAELALPSGSHRFRVDNLRFRVQVPAADAGETFTFIVDASERHRMKVFYFKKSVLAYRGQAPTIAQQAEAPALERITLPSGQTVELNADDVLALEVARDQMALLSDLNLNLNKKESSNRYNLAGSLVENISMDHLGEDQYLAEVTMQSGRQSIRINRSSFRIEVPSSDEGEVYLFFLDGSRPSRLQVTYFKKSLLQYL